jgi:hypothetical protein
MGDLVRIGQRGRERFHPRAQASELRHLGDGLKHYNAGQRANPADDALDLLLRCRQILPQHLPRRAQRRDKGGAIALVHPRQGGQFRQIRFNQVRSVLFEMSPGCRQREPDARLPHPRV